VRWRACPVNPPTGSDAGAHGGPRRLIWHCCVVRSPRVEDDRGAWQVQMVSASSSKVMRSRWRLGVSVAMS
jgi:hypothetical protein